MPDDPKKEARVRSRALKFDDTFQPVTLEVLNGSGPKLASTLMDTVEAAKLAKDDTAIDMKEVSRLTSLSRQTIWRRVGDGTFPRPFAVGQGENRPRRAWLRSEVVKWIHERAR